MSLLVRTKMHFSVGGCANDIHLLFWSVIKSCYLVIIVISVSCKISHGTVTAICLICSWL